MQKGKDKAAVVLWLLSGVVLVTAMVVVGGITRLTNSGLSIVEWNLISGTLPPLSAEEWHIAFDKYKQFPEYLKLRQGMTLAEFKSIFWWEFMHRLLGRFIGIVFMVPFLYFLVRKKLKPWLVKRLLFILVLGAAQGLMGWLMVKSGLQDNPHVSHYRLAMHLSLALLLIGTILWTIFDLVYEVKRKKRKPQPLYPLSTYMLLLIFIQIVLGAFVAGLKAGFSYNTYPLMGNEFFPTAILEGLTVSELFNNGVAVQFIHRWFAILVLGLILFFWKHTRMLPESTARRAANRLAIVALIQVGLGIATLVLAVPILLGVLHQLVAVVLFSIALLVSHRLKYFYKKKESKRKDKPAKQLAAN